MTGTSAGVVDRDWLEATCLELLGTPTSVPEGATEIRPGDPGILRALEDVVVPMIESLGPDELRRHDLGDVVARFGPPGDDGLLVETYIVSQHGSPADGASGPRHVDGEVHGLTGPCLAGAGASQNKGPMAAALTAIRGLRTAHLERPVWLAVNTEGRSSHGGSQRIIDDLGVWADQAVVSIGTDLAVSLGNRGRVDVHVTVPGESCHSSQPSLGSNPIDGAADVIRALRDTPVPEPHPDLGAATVTPYRLVFSPVAPHTIPAVGEIVVDRRLLPGEDPAAAVDALQHYLGSSVDADVKVTEGASMLPAALTTDTPVVVALRAGVAASTGRDIPPFWSRNTFDAGYGCHRGIPTCMFGPGRRSFARGLTASEVVSLDDCAHAANALRTAIDALCGD